MLDDELRLTHYRDKDQVEVDIVIEQGRGVCGIKRKRIRQTAIQLFL